MNNYGTNYYSLLNNFQIKNSLYLYLNYKRLEQKVKRKEKEPKSEKLYLINKNIMDKIKNECKFKKLNEVFEKYNINESDGNINEKTVTALKSLSQNDLISILKSKNITSKYPVKKNAPNSTLIPCQNSCFLIFENFELLYEDIFIYLFDINPNKYNYFFNFECILNESYIIINYPNTFNQIVSVIGKINDNKVFMTEYILKYINDRIRYNHLKFIKGKTHEYLNNLQLYKNTQPIINSKFEEMGIIIKYDSYNDQNNNDKNISEETIQRLTEEKKNLEKKLTEEKNKSKYMEGKIISLKTELEKTSKKYKDLYRQYTNDKNKFNSNINNVNSEESSLYQLIIEKDKKIKELEEKLKRYPIELNEGEKLLTLNFNSLDQKLKNYSIICKNTDIFNYVEKKIYDDNKEYYDTENYFTVNGKKIHKYKNLDENGIKNNDVIILNVLDI